MEEKLCDFTSLEAVCGGDKDFMNQMIELFKTNIPKELDEIKLSIQNKDFDSVKKLAHKMKPSVGYICKESMSETVKFIERWEQSDEVMIDKTNGFIHEMNKVIAEIKMAA